MDRPAVLQPLIDLYEVPRYLEIGVSQGETFHALRAALKIAVDPHFGFEIPTAPSSEVQYFPCTSDSFFSRYDGPLFNVIYLDGLHTFEQTLRDLLNSIGVLERDGVIVIYDILPNSYEASLGESAQCIAVRSMTGNKDTAWMGDVYKLAFFVEAYLRYFDYATIMDNHGQLILWRAPGGHGSTAERSVSDICRIQYADLLLNRASYRFASFSDVLRRVSRSTYVNDSDTHGGAAG